ncbi:MAG: HD-GYP domain-containing protein [Longimicrobiaceae bacterium]
MFSNDGSSAPTHLSVRAISLAGAALVGAAWKLDALRRDRRAARMHRVAIELLLNALQADDAVTGRHSRRVADLADALADQFRMNRRERATLRVAALLHDMGKVDDRFFHIIHSRDPLTPEQRAEMEGHPGHGADILEPLEAIHPGIREIVSSHHECWDGSGYPQGRAASEIPLGARIIALADVFDAITQPRAYRDPVEIPVALDHLRQGAHSKFDPQLVELIATPRVWTRWARIARRGLRDERSQEDEPAPASG